MGELSATRFFFAHENWTPWCGPAEPPAKGRAGASGVSMKGDGAGSEMPGPQAVSQTQVRKAAP